MKTLKNILVVVLVAFSTTMFANADPITDLMGRTDKETKELIHNEIGQIMKNNSLPV